MNDDFDERQRLLRLKGYKHAYFLTIFLCLLILISSLFLEGQFFTSSTVIILIVFIPLIFLSFYFNLKDIRFTEKEQKKNGFATVLILIMGVLLAVANWYSLRGRSFIEEGRLSATRLSSLLMSILLIITGVLGSYNYFKNKE
ncbi:MAG TPA: hypothetical protein H9829_00295 [Candidatus Tetragenococcus pullicola]|nr:hypothetical protein [Candidatus Tetragenococcus pullicola]